MESKRQTESVLAKLLGLERPLPSKLLRHGRRRVLSESYLQDIALISQHHKWSFDRFSMDADDTMLERRDSSEDLQSSSSSEESLERYRIEDKMFQQLWLLSSSQKGYSSRGDSYSQKVKSPKKMENASQTRARNVLQNHKVGNSHYVQLLSSNGGKAETFSPMRKNGTGLGKRVRDCLSGREALGHRSVSTHGIAKQVAQELQHSVWHDCLKAAEPVKAQDSFPRNMNTNNSKSTSLGSSESSKCRNKNLVVHKDWCLNLVSEGSSYCKSLQKVNCKSEEDLTLRKSTSIITSLHSEKDGSCEETPSTPTDLSEFAERHLFEDYPSVCVLPRDISTYSDVESVSSINKECVNVDSISEQVVDDTFMPLHQADNGYPLYKMEAYKPNSDAASNIKDISPAAYFSAIHGSEVKLQQSTISYPEAKRHKRIDVKDAEEGGDKSHSGEIITGIYKNEETRALSYLIDVLAESGLQCGNLETCYKLGQPLENPINPFVFDALEKKYRKQPSWLKSERRLLFDRITCAFSDILHPNTGINTWRTYKTNRLLFHCNQDMIREELLSVLVNQEKQAKRVSSEKVVGLDCDWLELEEDMQIVVKEIEEVLINDFVEEIVSMELFI